MEPITYREFQDALRSARRAWHLELRDTYKVTYEKAPIARWRNGEPEDFAFLEEWLSFVREVTERGLAVERLRLVTLPHTEYTQWSLFVAEQNVAAGEDVRYLPIREPLGVALPAEDCWLLDDDRLILSLFAPDGEAGGFAREEAPELIAEYRAVRDALWPMGISHSEYVTR